MFSAFYVISEVLAIATNSLWPEVSRTFRTEVSGHFGPTEKVETLRT